MCKLGPLHRRREAQRLAILGGWVFICMLSPMSGAQVLAQRARAPVSPAAAASPYVVDGLALGARVDSQSPGYRGYQCSPSEQFPDFTRCQRTQKQLYEGGRRALEVTSATLHGRDGKTVYINRSIAPWSFNRTDIQTELKQLSSKFGEPAREMRLPPHEGLQTAMIATWGKIELTRLDADAISILAAGESPRKGLLIDYLGNLRRSAQLGLSVYSISGEAGYLWSASVDRHNLGHIRILAVDPTALFPAKFESPATAESPATTESAVAPVELPSGETANIAAAGTETLTGDREPARIPAEQTSVAAGAAKTDIEQTGTPQITADPEPALIASQQTSVAAAADETAVQQAGAAEGDKIAPVLARVEAKLATADARLEKLTYSALGGLIVLAMIAASLVLVWRKAARATKLQLSTSEAAKPSPRAQMLSQALSSEAQSVVPQHKLRENQGTAEMAAVSGSTVFADATSSQNGHEQHRAVGRENGSQKQDHNVAAVKRRKKQKAELASASAGPREASARKRICSPCGQEIGVSDKFCRHCGASSLPVAAPN